MKTTDLDRWIVVRRRVSLAGRVSAAGGGMAGGGSLALTSAAASTERDGMGSVRGAVWWRDALVRRDSWYFFLDLPAGDYVLSGRDDRGDAIEAGPVSILPTMGLSKPQVVHLDLIASTDRASGGRRAAVKIRGEPAKRRRGATSAD